jgi:putative transposase
MPQTQLGRRGPQCLAIGVAEDGFREVLGICGGAKEDTESWSNFLRYLKQRGLKGIQLVISDKCLGLVEALSKFFPDARWQRCVVHFYRNVFSVVPKGKVREVAAMLKAIHAQEDREEAQKKAEAVAKKLEVMKLTKAAGLVRAGAEETLCYYAFPREHWRLLRTNYPLERVMREIRRRSRVVGCFPDGNSALMLAAARLRHIAGIRWGTKKYMNMKRLQEQKVEVLVVAG